MSAIKKLFGQTIIYGFSSVLARILNFLLVPLYTILFIPSEYAVVSEMYAYAAFFMVLGSFGMETTFFRFMQIEKSKKNSNAFSTAFFFVVFNGFLLSVIGFFFQDQIAHLIRHESHPEYITCFIFIIALDLLSIIPFALLRQQNKAFKFAFLKTLNICINIFFNIFFLLICPELLNNTLTSNLVATFYNSDISVGYVFISNLIASGITVLMLVPEIKNNTNKFDKDLFKKMISYAWPILIAGIAFIINETADKILIKYLLPSGVAMRELGIYSACYKLSIFMTLFVQAYRFAAEPFFFNQFNKPDSKKIYSIMLDFFVLFALMIFLFVVLYIDIIKLIIPNQIYHEGIIIIPIVLMANIFLGIYYNLSVWYKVTNLTKYAAIISLCGAAITILLNLIFIPLYGYIAAAWTTLSCYLIMTILSFYLGQKNFKINYNLKSVFKYFSFAISLFLASSIFHQSYLNIQIDNTIIFLIYLIFMYWQIKKIFKKTALPL